VILAFLLYSKPRFINSKSNNPYIMFDTKTAQACWSGPPTDPYAEFGGHALPSANSEVKKSDPFLAAIGSSDANTGDPFAAFKALNSTANSAGIPFCTSLKKD
jgi:hypothetical protein